MSGRNLSVYLNGIRTGILHESKSSSLKFSYADDAKMPISLAMALGATYDDAKTRVFFENLLPEGDLRQQVAKTYGVSANNPFSLLKAIGRDCAGAIVICDDLLVDDHVEAPMVFSFEQIINSNNQTIQYTKGMRLSLAGAQYKTTVAIKNEVFYLPSASFPSTHIIKFANPIYQDIVINEFFCMTLAKNIGLNVPAVMMSSYGPHPYLLVQRYDRHQDNEKVVRIHQEDFCQILGYLSSNKYQDDGGPKLVQIVNAINQYSHRKAADIAALAKIVIFNYLIGNCDAHGKNFAMIHSGNGSYLAPFYDLVATAVYPNLSSRMAMSLGGISELDLISKEAIIKEFNNFGINGKRMFDLVIKDFSNIVNIGKQIGSSDILKSHDGLINAIIENISKRFDHLKKIFNFFD